MLPTLLNIGFISENVKLYLNIISFSNYFYLYKIADLL